MENAPHNPRRGRVPKRRFAMEPAKPEVFDAKITEKLEPAPGVVTLRLVACDGRKFVFKQGQFAMLCFKDEPDPTRKCRAYSVSSSANAQDHLDLTIKIVKEWTTRMTSMPVGSTVQLKFPFGHFTLDDADDEVIFLAGGVGVTPFMGMVRYLSENNSPKKAALFYSAHTAKGIVFREELERIASQWPNLKLVLSVSGNEPDDDAWNGRRGRISADSLKTELGGEYLRKKYYICGPKAMAQALQAILDELGVPKENIRTEAF